MSKPKRSEASQLIFTALAVTYPSKIEVYDLIMALGDPNINIAHVTGTINGLIRKGHGEQEYTVNEKGETIKTIGLTKKGAEQAKDEGLPVKV